MCQAASFIITKEKILWAIGSNSHTEIMTRNNLQDSKDIRSPNYVKVEITPPDNDFSLPFDKWVYRVDQDMLPDWYVPKFDEERCRNEIQNWFNAHIVVQNTDAGNITQTAGDRSTQTAGDWSTQTAGDRSTQKAGGGSTQKAGGRSTQTAGEGSTQTAGEGSTQTAGEKSVQIGYWYDMEYKVATRIVSKDEADKPYKFEKGIWVAI